MLANSPIEGVLLFLYLAAPVLALAAAFVIRWRYRAAVGRLMQTTSGGDRSAIADSDTGERPGHPPPGPLTIVTDTPSGSAFPARTVLSFSLGYFAAGLVHGISSTVILFVLNGIEFLPVRTTIVSMVFSTPAVFSGLLAIGARFHVIVLAAIAWLALAIAIASPFGGGFAVVWQLSWFVALPLLTTVLVINRTVGTIAPLLLIPAMLFAFSGLLTLDMALIALQTFRSNFAAFAAAGLTLIAGLAAGIAYLALTAWLFSRGRASEITLQTDMLWLLVSTFHAIPLFPQFGWSAMAMFIPFVAYRIALRLFSLATGERSEPRRLLFLRVFGFMKRQAELHRLFLNTWRRRGSVVLIGSQDLALEVLDPPELFAFITGRLKRIFVDDPEAVSTVHLNRQQNPAVDGLYPVDDFYCHDDTWRSTVALLIDASAAVLMDLRGFGPANMGCLFEIEQLLARAEPEQLNFLVDDSTDMLFLEKCIHEAWARRTGEPAATSGLRLWTISDGKALRRLAHQDLT